MKFTYERCQNIFNLLDRNISLKDRSIFTDLHIKPTDAHQFLDYGSSYPSFNEALTINRLCSSSNDFSAHTLNVMNLCLARNHPKKVVGEQIDKEVFGKQPCCKDNSERGVPFVVTYHSKLKGVSKLTKILQLSLYRESEVRRVLTYGILSNDYIVRPKLYFIERKVGNVRYVQVHTGPYNIF